MEKQKGGHIINGSSVCGHKVGLATVVYCATKFAMRALSDVLRHEAKPYNIRTTVISTGTVATELRSTFANRRLRSVSTLGQNPGR
jgi:NADP-dependent 3-hydroxy acid dehydrogenase YdfG